MPSCIVQFNRRMAPPGTAFYASIEADLVGIVGRHRCVIDVPADRPLEYGRVDEGGFGMRVARRVAARAARCRASFLHRRNDGSPLTLQQHHDEPGRLRVAGVAPHDVNIVGPLVERLSGLERDGRFAF